MPSIVIDSVLNILAGYIERSETPEEKLEFTSLLELYLDGSLKVTIIDNKMIVSM